MYLATEVGIHRAEYHNIDESKVTMIVIKDRFFDIEQQGAFSYLLISGNFKKTGNTLEI